MKGQADIVRYGHYSNAIKSKALQLSREIHNAWKSFLGPCKVDMLTDLLMEWTVWWMIEVESAEVES